MSEHYTTPENPSDIMTSAEAMEFLRMGRSAFYKALRAGEIPCRRYSPRVIRFSREALKADLSLFRGWVDDGGPPGGCRASPPPTLNF